MADEIRQMDEEHNELLYSITNGDPGAMRELVKFDVFDFFAYVDNYMKGKKK